MSEAWFGKSNIRPKPKGCRCSVCAGTGLITCDDCDGLGYIEEDVDDEIPPNGDDWFAVDYPPSTAATITSIEHLKAWMAKEHGTEGQQCPAA